MQPMGWGYPPPAAPPTTAAGATGAGATPQPPPHAAVQPGLQQPSTTPWSMQPQVLAVRTTVSVARATLLLCVLAVSTDAGAMAFKNECAWVRSAGASLLRGSAKKGASAARALATGAKVKTTAVKDEEQPQQQQVQQQQLQQQAAVQQATLQLLQQ